MYETGDNNFERPNANYFETNVKLLFFSFFAVLVELILNYAVHFDTAKWLELLDTIYIQTVIHRREIVSPSSFVLIFFTSSIYRLLYRERNYREYFFFRRAFRD